MKNKILFLESLRGLAAIYVLIHHCRWLLAESYAYRTTNFDIEYLLTKILTFFRFGHEAVIFFFVLSGFVIHHSVQNNSTTISYFSFFKKRINRIIPPLLFALIITFLLDYSGKYIFNLPTYYHGSKYFELVVDNLSWLSFTGNLFLLQDLNTGIKHFGSNGALWSLSYEWWFYLLYPFFYALNSKNKFVPLFLQIILFIVFSTLIKQALPIASAIFSKMIIWWFGVVLAELFINYKRWMPYLSILVAGIPIAIIMFYNNRMFGGIFWGIGFFGLLAGLLSLNKKSIIIRILNRFEGTGKFSYTLYLTHFPILFLAHAALLKLNNGSLPTTYSYALAMSILCVFFAKICSPYIEKIKVFQNYKI